jgi:hypothetical protein
MFGFSAFASAAFNSLLDVISPQPSNTVKSGSNRLLNIFKQQAVKAAITQQRQLQAITKKEAQEIKAKQALEVQVPKKQIAKVLSTKFIEIKDVPTKINNVVLQKAYTPLIDSSVRQLLNSIAEQNRYVTAAQQQQADALYQNEEDAAIFLLLNVDVHNPPAIQYPDTDADKIMALLLLS